MNTQAMQDLSSEYVHWLKSNLIVFERGTSQVLSTPFLDPFNDGIEILLDVTGGEMVLHDGGRTLDTLMDMGVHEIFELVTKSGRRIRTTANHPYLAQIQISKS